MKDPLSCIVENALRFVGRHPRPAWKSGRVVEGATLEMLLRGNPYGGSNPLSSALEEWPSGLWQLS
jgi:hypothetical protein